MEPHTIDYLHALSSVTLSYNELHLVDDCLTMETHDNTPVNVWLPLTMTSSTGNDIITTGNDIIIKYQLNGALQCEDQNFIFESHVIEQCEAAQRVTPGSEFCHFLSRLTNENDCYIQCQVSSNDIHWNFLALNFTPTGPVRLCALSTG